jgi:hypothetical protein
MLGSLALCAMGLSACQTTGAPGTNAALGATQNSPRGAPPGVNLHQVQAKSLSGAPKRASRPYQPTIIGIAF